MTIKEAFDTVLTAKVHYREPRFYCNRNFVDTARRIMGHPLPQHRTETDQTVLGMPVILDTTMRPDELRIETPRESVTIRLTGG